jgi:hypothetical protein
MHIVQQTFDNSLKFFPTSEKTFVAPLENSVY